MKKSIIAAMSTNGVIGRDNQLPWHMPADMKHFKHMTQGHPVIMGRKTLHSMGNKPLPNRLNIVLSRNKQTPPSQDFHMVHTLKEAFALAANSGAQETFIIGGSQLYHLALPFTDTLYITEIHAHIEGDTYFPTLDHSEWEKISKKSHKADEKNRYDYSFFTYNRKNKNHLG